jgi:hypothetical protein
MVFATREEQEYNLSNNQTDQINRRTDLAQQSCKSALTALKLALYPVSVRTSSR